MNQKLLVLGLLMGLFTTPAWSQVRLPPKKNAATSATQVLMPAATTPKTATTTKPTPQQAQQQQTGSQVVAPAPTTYQVPDNLKGVFSGKDRYMGYPFYGGNNFLQSNTVRFTSQYDIGATVKGVSGQSMKMNGQDYMYKDGYFFKKLDGKGNYQVVQPPAGATIPKLPPNAVPVGGGYYFNGAFYHRKSQGQGYEASKPPRGTLVPYLTNAAKPTRSSNGDQVFKDGDTYYQPYYVQGNMGNIVQYEVVH